MNPVGKFTIISPGPAIGQCQLQPGKKGIINSIRIIHRGKKEKK